MIQHYNYKGKNLKKYSTGGVIGDTLSGVGSGAGIGTMIMPGIGTAIGAGVGLLGGLAKGLFQNSAEKKAEEEQARNDFIAKTNNEGLVNSQRLDEYSTNGYNINSMYSKGGKIPTKDSAKYKAYIEFLKRQYIKDHSKKSNLKLDFNDATRDKETLGGAAINFLDSGINALGRTIGAIADPVVHPLLKAIGINSNPSNNSYLENIYNSAKATPEEIKSYSSGFAKEDPIKLANVVGNMALFGSGNYLDAAYGEARPTLSSIYNEGLKKIGGKYMSSDVIDNFANPNSMRGAITPTYKQLNYSINKRAIEGGNIEDAFNTYLKEKRLFTDSDIAKLKSNKKYEEELNNWITTNSTNNLVSRVSNNPKYEPLPNEKVITDYADRLNVNNVSNPENNNFKFKLNTTEPEINQDIATNYIKSNLGINKLGRKLKPNRNIISPNQSEINPDLAYQRNQELNLNSIRKALNIEKQSGKAKSNIKPINEYINSKTPSDIKSIIKDNLKSSRINLIKSNDYLGYYQRNIEGTQADKGSSAFIDMILSDPNYKYSIDNELKQGFSKGGKIPNIKTSANVNKIGNGIAVYGNKSKDSINATVNGTPVKLDNKEVVVMYKGNPVVISDDLGEASKYKEEIRNSNNKQAVADKYAERALMLQEYNNNNNNSYVLGGGIPDSLSYLANKYPYSSFDSIYNQDSIATSPISQEQFNAFNKIYDGRYKSVNGIPAPFIGVNNYSETPIPRPIDNNNLQQQDFVTQQVQVVNPKSNTPKTTKPIANYHIGNIDTIKPTNINTKISTLPDVNMNYKMPTNIPSSKGTLGSFIGNNGSNIASGLGFLGNTISNIAAYSKLNKLHRPTPSLATYVQMNVDANKPIFEQQRSDLNTTIDNYKNQILNNTSNSNVALARIASMNANKIGANNRITSAQVSDRNRIANQNISGRNITNMNNSRTTNNYNNQAYADSIGRIQAGTGLAGSTLQGLNGIINNMKRDKYQTEYLNAIAKQVGFNTNGNFDINNLSKAQQLQLTTLLKQQGLI